MEDIGRLINVVNNKGEMPQRLAFCRSNDRGRNRGIFLERLIALICLTTQVKNSA